MIRSRLLGAIAAIGLLLGGCSAPVRRPLVDPVRLAFPLSEEGTLEIEGTVIGQPRARDGIVYFTTREGFLTAAVPSAQSILWRFEADKPLACGPELGEGHIIVRDVANTVYVLDTKGSLVFKISLDETVSTTVREVGARIYLGTESGRLLAIDASQAGAQLWDYQVGSRVTAGPVSAGNLIVCGAENGRLLALDQAGRLVWEFGAEGAVAADPAVGGGHMYFGTASRFFYCLNAATGQKRWSRRLQGAPLHQALISGRRLALASSNSALYFLSGRGGSILSWEAVPSRILYEPAAAGPLLLVSSANESFSAFDLKTGKRVGQHLAPGPLVAGALWISPFVVLIDEDQGTGRQRLAFLRSRPVSKAAVSGAKALGR
jgi:outer membrane protein assembly factor BamB